MGAKESRQFPYELGPIVGSALGWNAHRGSRRVVVGSGGNPAVDGPVTIFLFDKTDRPPSVVAAAQNALKRHKTIRHPSFLTFVDGIELESKIYIVVEGLIRPLLASIEFSEVQTRPDVLVWGLHQITTGLAFLHTECNLVHGAISVDTIYVNGAGDWLIGNLDLVSSLEDDSAPLRSIPVPSKALPAELQQSPCRWSMIRTSPIFSIDSFALGALIYHVANWSPDRPPVSARSFNEPRRIPAAVVPYWKVLIDPQPSKRLSCVDLLRNIAVKEAAEKDAFFAQLPSVLHLLPSYICKYKVLPLLIRALEFGGAPAGVLETMLQLGKSLSPEEFSQLVVPSVVRLFAAPERGVRMHLLLNIGQFVPYLSKDVVSEKIFPHVVGGFNDSSKEIREATVKSMALIAPLLSGKLISGTLLRHFARLQLDECPSVRTNTTLCLGKIAGSIPEKTRQEILAPAFVRALRDPFPPTRRAALQAIHATQSYFSMKDVTLRILPAMCPCLGDSNADVRKQGFRTMKGLLDLLEKESDRLERLEAERAARQKPDSVATASRRSLPAEQGEKAKAGGGWASSLSRKLWRSESQNDDADQEPAQEKIDVIGRGELRSARIVDPREIAKSIDQSDERRLRFEERKREREERRAARQRERDMERVRMAQVGDSGPFGAFRNSAGGQEEEEPVSVAPMRIMPGQHPSLVPPSPGSDEVPTIHRLARLREYDGEFGGKLDGSFEYPDEVVDNVDLGDWNRPLPAVSDRSESSSSVLSPTPFSSGEVVNPFDVPSQTPVSKAPEDENNAQDWGASWKIEPEEPSEDSGQTPVVQALDTDDAVGAGWDVVEEEDAVGAGWDL